MKFQVLGLIIFVMVINTACDFTEVDMLIKNAKIYTVDDDFSVVSGMVIQDGKILDLGDWEMLSKKYRSKIELDLHGKVVYPGFIDAHSHFYGLGTFLHMADLNGTKSFEELLQRLKEHYNLYPGEWIVGRGWDQNNWPKKVFPDNHELNDLFPDVNVVLIRIDGHAVLANDKMLKTANIDSETIIPGGEIVKEKGVPTGVVLDKAADLVRELIPELTLADKRKVIAEAQSRCFGVGLTTVCDAGLDVDIIELYETMHADGALKMRIYAMLNPGEENEARYMKNGPYITDRLTVRSVKLYADGALGSRGAALLAPYTDDPGNSGMLVNEKSYLEAVCKRAYDAGFQVNTHAIGDSANRFVLDIYSSFLKGKNDRRWRIEHAQVVDPSDLHKFGDYSIIPSIQSTHCTSDMKWADNRLGEERIKNGYIYNELLAQNGWLPNGTDFPIENINPIYTFYAAVFRKNIEGWPIGGFQMENALSREDALRSITIWAAKAGFGEDIKGSFVKGKVADFVILDTDIMVADEEDILPARVLATFIDGQLMIKDDSFNLKLN